MQKLTLTLLCSVIAVFCMQSMTAQEISVYQYRHVPADNIDDFLYRELNYWQKVAQKAIDDDKMEFWALLEKVGGYDLPNSSNYLFVNTFKDIDADGVWNPAAVFPNVPIDQMETNSISTVTSQIFVQPRNWAQPDDANPDEDFKYVIINYWNCSEPEAWIAMENEHWAPFIKGEMAKDATSMKAWGNAMILAPRGLGMPATNMSFDLFSSLHSALLPQWAEDAEFPEEAINAQVENLIDPRAFVVYRIVAVASSED